MGQSEREDGRGQALGFPRQGFSDAVNPQSSQNFTAMFQGISPSARVWYAELLGGASVLLGGRT